MLRVDTTSARMGRMAYDPYPEKLKQVATAFPELASELARLDGERTVAAAAALLEKYFARHRQGDVKSLRQIAYAFSDKRLARDLVDRTLADASLLEKVAARSYPHPIGFDKLVLHEHAAFKFRLHMYWRTPQEVAQERIHLHRFEMASAPITGELTNHLYAVRRFDGAGIHTDPGDGSTRRYLAYTGYERDAAGALHKRYLGAAELAPLGTVTYVPGQSYAQTLEHAHFVETNAETGHTNGDVCSTIYIHGAGLKDGQGRRIPILFEEERIPDAVVKTIASVAPAQLDASLRRYRALLDESLRFYDWLYDPKYGRNLSTGMVAGYFLSEAFGSSRTIEMWEQHRAACVDVLAARSRTLAALVTGDERVEALPGDDRCTRYFQQLLNKAWDHPGGRRDWLAQHGDLVREWGRYLGALLGDYARNRPIKVLKPIWELSGTRLAGGAHYGRVQAMLEAVRTVTPMVLARFRSPDLTATDDGEGPVTIVDTAVQAEVRRVLAQHYPDVAFAGEGAGTAGASATRWLVDPIDGTRNFVNGQNNFAISLAHQRRAGDVWETTDAVVALPAHGEIYWAERGQGAYLIGWDGREVRLRVPEGAGDLVDVSGRGFGPGLPALLARLTAAGATLRGTGCAALMLCMVAGTGNAAALVTANDYDVAAGLLVAAEAGATLSQVSFTRDGRAFTAYLAGATREWHARLEAAVTSAP